jgi:hypothetical protein
MTDHASNGNAEREPLRRIVVSRPDSAFETVIIPLEGELRDALTVGPLPPRPPRRDSIFDENGYLKPPRVPPVRRELFDENGYLKPPRLPRPDNLRWWERLKWAWRGL